MRHRARPPRIAATSLALLAVGAPHVYAGTTPVVIEAYVGARPDSASADLEDTQAELASRDYRVGAAGVGRPYAAKGPRPGQTATEEEVKLAAKLIESGYDAMLGALYDEAINALSAALATLDASPALVIDDQNLKTAIFKGLVGLALAQSKLGDQDEAEAMMADLIRRDPNTINLDPIHGSDAVRLHARVRKAVLAQGTGTLSITVDDPDVQAYIDGIPIGVGAVLQKKLGIGAHQVLLRKDKISRVYDVAVDADAESDLEVVWACDSALQSSSESIAFVFPDQRAFDRLGGTCARRVAEALDTDTFVVLTSGKVSGHRTVSGWAYGPEHPTPETAAVPVEPTMSHDRLRALGAFLAGDPDALSVAMPSASSGIRWRKVLPWVFMGTGVAAMVVGGVFYAYDEDEIQNGDRVFVYYDTAPAAIATMSVGAAVAATGLVWYLLGRRSSTERNVNAVSIDVHGGSVGVVLGGTF